MPTEIYLPATVIACLLILVSVGWIRTYRRYKRAASTLKEMGQELAEKSRKIEQLTSTDIVETLAAPTGSSLLLAFDPNGIITYVNDHAESFFGFTQEELIGHTLESTLLPPPERPRAGEPSLPEKIKTNPKLYINIDMQMRRKDAMPVWVSWTYRLVYDQNNTLKEVRAVGFDVSKRKALEEKIHHLTSIDLLTGVLKRTAFMAIAEQEVRRAIRYDRQLSLLIVRLDYLRLLGQDKDFETGEQALKQVIKACQQSIREMDVIGRIEDVEFAILMPETPHDNISVVADRLYLKLQELSDKQKISFGQTALQDKTDTIDAMLQRAEQNLAVYTQK